ncbi:metallophosphoesterase [Campylobacter sp. LR264d]|uniref:metallophosphoesterase n=1 Tax=unclassified Campylobacter TaxID=2593542 RepID=UPI001238170D|nr:MULTISPECIES: metallophosphoesterase [unclassified Campylobacter]KAA6225566.1 metallophosphoesterase [Campylobacter sp. LR185c]KAA6230534.1 metallophosphoesterase [Campylobacter sp. LR264d]KAA8604999.1 metallophosphoesterase [Campylobacter sp. LR185c]
MIFLIFSFVVLLIFAVANVYIYKRLICKFFLFTHLKPLFIVIFSLLFICQVFFLAVRKVELLSNDIYSFLSMLYAPTYCLFFITLILDILRLLYYFTGKQKLKCPFTRSIFELLIIGLSSYLAYFSIYSAIKIPDIKEVEIKLPKLKQDLKIAMLTDIHLGKNLHKEFLNALIEKVNAQNVDMVVIVGDLVDTNVKEIESYISDLDLFNTKFGVYYSLGNHEYYRGVYEIIELLKTKTKMNILINENIDLGFINIAGLGDLAGLQNRGILGPDLQRVKVDMDFSKPSILLAHQPKTALLYDLSDFDLILSGHTHGGQIFPFMFLVELNQGFISGLHELGKQTQIFISTGAGFWGPSLRMLTQSEIVILNLKGEK